MTSHQKKITFTENAPWTLSRFNALWPANDNTYLVCHSGTKNSFAFCRLGMGNKTNKKGQN